MFYEKEHRLYDCSRHSDCRVIMRFSEYYIDKSSPKEPGQARHGVLGRPPILKRTLKEALWEPGRVIAYESPSKRATRACTGRASGTMYWDGISHHGSGRIYLSRVRWSRFPRRVRQCIHEVVFCISVRSIYLDCNWSQIQGHIRHSIIYSFLRFCEMRNWYFFVRIWN